ncbi:uncharacterized protein AMSG_06248 [Thecamonas trahens ATCC 50062]|uniref:Right handed beta helix domain-containing protein n=1 Tax=Thecamonas trahens ATCC 50062 TaxID=461836 RepID=A0A0L0DCH8_THETB|nr:hypothetical protein AMSG_06248 [Thecamonas trahens ATCC 50062]KNC49940.1 hypothetical protein AMSG_06248 [Thecamonas trahens ATCC 50062]|eukprot:XP_013757417.1 hypothetical protein AMSG_06248 [Thecamonas trahens ATCC 50062]
MYSFWVLVIVRGQQDGSTVIDCSSSSAAAVVFDLALAGSRSADITFEYLSFVSVAAAVVVDMPPKIVLNIANISVTNGSGYALQVLSGGSVVVNGATTLHTPLLHHTGGVAALSSIALAGLDVRGSGDAQLAPVTVVNPAASLAISNSQFADMVVDSSVVASPQVAASLIDTMIANVTSAGTGGTLISNAALISGCVFADVAMSGSGKAVVSTSSPVATLRVETSSFVRVSIDNISPMQGVIHRGPGGAIEVVDTVVSECHAPALLTYTVASGVVVRDVHFFDNVVSSGLVTGFVSTPSLVLERARLESNAVTGAGATVDVTVAAGGAAVVDGCVFYSNSAGGAGGLALTGTTGSVTLRGGNMFLANAGAGDGGGLAITLPTGTLVSDGLPTVLTGNAALGSGGGLALEVPSVPAQFVVNATENRAGANGGGAYLVAVTSLGGHWTLSKNSAQAAGGGLALTDSGGTSGTFALAASASWTLSSNSAGANGGGLAVLASALSGFDATAPDALLEVTHNTAASSGGGLALMASTGHRLGSTAAVQVTGNTAEVSGGGLYVAGSFGMVVSVGGATVAGNTATTGSGGGMLMASTGGALDVRDAHFTGNRVLSALATTGGGGIFVSGAELNATRTVFAQNTVTGLGSALMLATGVDASLSECSVESNTGAGAAIYLAAATQLVANASVVRSNSATSSQPGGLYIEDTASAWFDPLAAVCGNTGGVCEPNVVCGGSSAKSYGLPNGCGTGGSACRQGVPLGCSATARNAKCASCRNGWSGDDCSTALLCITPVCAAPESAKVPAFCPACELGSGRTPDLTGCMECTNGTFATLPSETCSVCSAQCASCVGLATNCTECVSADQELVAGPDGVTRCEMRSGSAGAGAGRVAFWDDAFGTGAVWARPSSLALELLVAVGVVALVLSAWSRKREARKYATDPMKWRALPFPLMVLAEHPLASLVVVQLVPGPPLLRLQERGLLLGLSLGAYLAAALALPVARHAAYSPGQSALSFDRLGDAALAASVGGLTSTFLATWLGPLLYADPRASRRQGFVASGCAAGVEALVMAGLTSMICLRPEGFSVPCVAAVVSASITLSLLVVEPAVTTFRHFVLGVRAIRVATCGNGGLLRSAQIAANWHTERLLSFDRVGIDMDVLLQTLPQRASEATSGELASQTQLYRVVVSNGAEAMDSLELLATEGDSCTPAVSVGAAPLVAGPGYQTRSGQQQQLAGQTALAAVYMIK